MTCAWLATLFPLINHRIFMAVSRYYCTPKLLNLELLRWNTKLIVTFPNHSWYDDNLGTINRFDRISEPIIRIVKSPKLFNEFAKPLIWLNWLYRRGENRRGRKLLAFVASKMYQARLISKIWIFRRWSFGVRLNRVIRFSVHGDRYIAWHSLMQAACRLVISFWISVLEINLIWINDGNERAIR